MSVWPCHGCWFWAVLCLFACAIHMHSEEESSSSSVLETLFGKEEWQRVQDLVSRGYCLRDQQGYYSDQDELLKSFLYLRERIGRVVICRGGVFVSQVEPCLRAFNELARQEWARGLVDDLLLELADEALQNKLYGEAIMVYDKILSDWSDGVPCIEWLRFPDRYDSPTMCSDAMCELGTGVCWHHFVRSYKKVEDPGRTIDLARAGKAIALLKSGLPAEVIQLMNAFLEKGESPPRAFGGDYPPVVEAFFFKAIALEQIGVPKADLHALRDEMISRGLGSFLEVPIISGEFTIRLGRERVRSMVLDESCPKVPEELFLATAEADSPEQATKVTSNEQNGSPAIMRSAIGNSKHTSQQDDQTASPEPTSLGRNTAVKPGMPLDSEHHREHGPRSSEIVVYIAAGVFGLLGLGIAIFHLVQHARHK